MSYRINVPEGTANTMKLTILGATGATGTALTGQALAAGHEVTAVVRDPARLAVPAHPRLRTVTADVMDPASIAPAVDGADAVLLITSVLSDAELAALLATASDLGMGALVETHAGDDLVRALASGAEAIGVNARDLETLVVDVDAALARLRDVPPDRLAVLESGIARGDQVTAAVEAGASAILVGETLMRAEDPAVTLRELIGKESER